MWMALRSTKAIDLVVIVRRGQEKKGKGKRWKQAEDAQKPAAPAFENNARKWAGTPISMLATRREDLDS